MRRTCAITDNGLSNHYNDGHSQAKDASERTVYIPYISSLISLQ